MKTFIFRTSVFTPRSKKENQWSSKGGMILWRSKGELQRRPVFFPANAEIENNDILDVVAYWDTDENCFIASDWTSVNPTDIMRQMGYLFVCPTLPPVVLDFRNEKEVKLYAGQEIRLNSNGIGTMSEPASPPAYVFTKKKELEDIAKEWAAIKFTPTNMIDFEELLLPHGSVVFQWAIGEFLLKNSSTIFKKKKVAIEDEVL